MAGTKEKGPPLKVLLYKSIIESVKEMAEPYPATHQAANLLQSTDVGWALNALSNSTKPTEEGKPWVLVAMFSPTDQGRAIRRLWNDPSLASLWTKGADGTWPVVGFKPGQARASRECLKVADLTGINLSKGKGKGGKARVSPKRSKSPSRGRDEAPRKRR